MAEHLLFAKIVRTAVCDAATASSLEHLLAIALVVLALMTVQVAADARPGTVTQLTVTHTRLVSV